MLKHLKGEAERLAFSREEASANDLRVFCLLRQLHVQYQFSISRSTLLEGSINLLYKSLAWKGESYHAGYL